MAQKINEDLEKAMKEQYKELGGKKGTAASLITQNKERIKALERKKEELSQQSRPNPTPMEKKNIEREIARLTEENKGLEKAAGKKSVINKVGRLGKKSVAKVGRFFTRIGSKKQSADFNQNGRPKNRR